MHRIRRNTAVRRALLRLQDMRTVICQTIGKFGVILEQVHGMDCLEKFFSSADFTTTTPWLQALRLFIQHAIRHGLQSEAAAAIHSSSGRIQEETQAILRIFFPRELQR